MNWRKPTCLISPWREALLEAWPAASSKEKYALFFLAAALCCAQERGYNRILARFHGGSLLFH
jgi:hypothetical protein